jgi:hypothetical protein
MDLYTVVLSDGEEIRGLLAAGFEYKADALTLLDEKGFVTAMFWKPMGFYLDLEE